jgi:hypothetical protein
MVKEEILFELVSMKTKRINIRVSESYIKRLNNIKKRTGVTVSEMIRRGLILYLDKYEI